MMAHIIKKKLLNVLVLVHENQPISKTANIYQYSENVQSLKKVFIGTDPQAQLGTIVNTINKALTLTREQAPAPLSQVFLQKNLFFEILESIFVIFVADVSLYFKLPYMTLLQYKKIDKAYKELRSQIRGCKEESKG